MHLFRTYKAAIILFWLCFSGISPALAAEPVQILYFHRPPLYIHQDGRPPTGILIELTRKILQTAKINHRFVNMPSRRILDTIERGGNYCSPGWFKNPNRERYAVFSLPIYRDSPLVLLVNKDKSNLLPDEVALEKALTAGLRLGVITGFSYGAWADRIIQQIRPNLETVTAAQKSLLSMLSLGRCDLMLMNMDEANWVMRNYRHLSQLLVMKNLSDAPAANLRYLLFSLDVNPGVIKRINAAIADKPPGHQ